MRAAWAALPVLVAAGCGFPDYKFVDEGGDDLLDGSIVDGNTSDTAPGEVCIAPNGCGGCEDQGVAGQRCGGAECSQWVCEGTKVVCKPTTPAQGSPCGACGTSQYTCTTAGTTTCAKPDDRTVYSDASFATKDDELATVDRTNEVLLSWDVSRKMAYAEASFALRRVPYACAKTAALPHPDPACTACTASDAGGFDCTVPTKTPGKITYTIYQGTPATTLTVLETGTADAITIGETASALVPIAFKGEVAARDVGTKLSIGITTDSTAWAFEVFGGGASAPPPKPPATTTWWRRGLLPSTAWTEQPATDLAHVVRGKACAP